MIEVPLPAVGMREYVFAQGVGAETAMIEPAATAIASPEFQARWRASEVIRDDKEPPSIAGDIAENVCLLVLGMEGEE